MERILVDLHVFCDFDGTIARHDVGNLVFTKYGDADHWWSLVQQWREQKIDAREMWQRQAAITSLSRKDLDAFARTQPIDPEFKPFVAYCSAHHIPITVVSDGMDAYIARILDHHGLGDLQIKSNRLVFAKENRLRVDFPYYENGCGICANCKGVHLKKSRDQGFTTLYVGDGYSDLCAVPEADILFAKDDLLEYCRAHSISCIPYKSFADVLAELKSRWSGSLS